MGYSFSPLNNKQSELFRQLRESLDEIQIAWLAGYLAAISSADKSTAILQKGISSKDNLDTLPLLNPVEKVPLTILVGSRTGNGLGLARQLQELAAGSGFDATIKNMSAYRVRDLAQEKKLIVIVSTHGEGEPPFEAKEVYEYVHGKRVPRLDGLKYAVLGLGDSSYLHFCQTGKDFDNQLEKSGAERIYEPAWLDVDFKNHVAAWFDGVLQAFGAVQKVKSTVVDAIKPDLTMETYSAQHPYQADILERIKLHGKGSDRKTIHLELAAEGLTYEAGDAVAVIPENNPALVAELLRITGLSGDAKVSAGNEALTLSDALRTRFELSKLTVDVLRRYNDFYKQEKLNAVLTNQNVLKDFVSGRDVVEFFRDYPVKMTAQQVVEVLRPLQPRQYSIASGPDAVPGEIHLTVAVVAYENRGRLKRGACSNYMADVDPEQKLNIYIEKNPNFRLPENPSAPIIMIGAGTGIAPYRAFMQQRELADHPGESWLFFGNRHFETEFLYQTEWQQYLQNGVLTRMNVAFSRDTDRKIYVQDRLLEHAREVYQWIESGAYVYVCGDRTHMAGDVMKALNTIIRQQGDYDEEKAGKYLDDLQKNKRLQVDVY